MRRPVTDVIGRVAAAAVLACGFVHVASAVDHWAMAPVPAGLTVVVALACLHCVPGLCRRPGRVEWVWVTLGSAAMLVLHLAMIVTMAAPAGGGPGHRHAGAMDTDAGGTHHLTDATTLLGLLLPVLGLCLAWWALGRDASRLPRTVRSLRTSWSPS